MNTEPGPRSSEPRDAAAVILIRERAGTGEAEVFMLRRHGGASFMARSFVFPGGAAEPGDRGLTETAARELFEEAGVRVAADSLLYFAHWITPSIEKIRFSARFFVAELPPGQKPSYDNVETVDEVWVTPDEALARAGELRLPPPQIRTMYDLRDAAKHGPQEVIALARERAGHPIAIMPRAEQVLGSPPRIVLLLPWDPAYPSAPGEGILMPKDHPLAQGPSRLILTDNGWQLVSDSLRELL